MRHADRPGTQVPDEIVFLVDRMADGALAARALDHSIFTEAGTLKELKRMVRCAVRCHWPGRRRPKRIFLYILKEKLTV